MSSTYHIVFPGGDRSKLKVIELVAALSYELSEYAVASRQEFPDRGEAVKYARKLAEQHGLEFVPDRDEPEDYYLD